MAKSGTNMKHRIIQLSGLLAIALLVVGVTAPDNWVAFTNTDGVKMFMPAWKNH
jgi:hypothetical protein